MRPTVCSTTATGEPALPLIGVDTFWPKDYDGEFVTEIKLIRST